MIVSDSRAEAINRTLDRKHSFIGCFFVPAVVLGALLHRISQREMKREVTQTSIGSAKNSMETAPNNEVM